MGNLSCKKMKERRESPTLAIMDIAQRFRGHSYSSVVIKASTWVKDAYSLFDYENLSLVRKNIKTAGACRLYLVGNDVVVRNDDVVPSKPYRETTVDKLAILTYHKGQYTLADSGRPTLDHDNKLYYVVKYLKSDQPYQYRLGYKLRENDVIKFGRVTYVVKEIKREPTSHLPYEESAPVPLPTDESKRSDDDNHSEEDVGLRGTESDGCRICRGEKGTPDNPLVSACKCSGSIKFIHANCMKAWYQSKTTVATTRCAISYIVKGLECELCKTKLPLTISHENGPIDLLNIQRPEKGPYVMFESIDDRLRTKFVHIARPDSNTVAMIGRSHGCDLKISDNTVSRSHAMLRYFGGEFYVEDNNSKFGTLVQIDKPIELAAHTPYCLQIGRTVLTIFVRNPNKPYDTLIRNVGAQGGQEAGGELVRRRTLEANTEVLQHEGAIDSVFNDARPSSALRNFNDPYL